IHDYEGARYAFLLAQQVNPEESLATDKITELDELISQITATQDAYDKAIETGDAAVRQEIVEEARYKYEQAQKLLPKEDYPAEMLAMIDSIQSERVRVAAEAEAERARLEAEDIAEQQAQQEAVAAEKEDKYEQAIKTAANLFAEDDFEGARASYLMAQQVKPEESLPGQKIVEIDVLLLNQAKNAQQAYDDLVAKGDDAFIQELFNEAEIFYEEAQQLKPDEEYPQQMLAKIDSTVEAGTRLAAENAAERAMQEALTEAENARQIAEAEEAEQKRLTTLNTETDYHHAIESADSLFALNEYKEALAAYRRAQQVKPDESLPEMRIDEINNLINRQTAAQQVYDAAIAKGDEAVSQELFDEARAAYHVARQARPEETYPEEMLTKIDSIV